MYENDEKLFWIQKWPQSKKQKEHFLDQIFHFKS